MSLFCNLFSGSAVSIRTVLKIYILLCVCILLNAGPIYPEIEKRVLKDGTLEYSNKAEKPAPAGKRKFDSPYNAMIERISKAQGLDPYLVMCIIKVESDFNPDAVSVAGAMGLMQIMQDIARHYNVKDPLDPEENLSAGTMHFRFLMDYFGNDAQLAVAAYHAGVGRVKKNMRVPPIQSTLDYVDRVMLLYTGEIQNVKEKVSNLYKRINSEGVIEIYNR